MTPRGKIKAIIRIVSRVSGIPVRVIMGDDRDQKAVHARQVAQALVEKHIGHVGVTTIGRIFGRDHTTVINSRERVEQALASGVNPQSALYRKVEARIAALIEGEFAPTTAIDEMRDIPRAQPARSRGYIDSDGAIICTP